MRRWQRRFGSLIVALLVFGSSFVVLAADGKPKPPGPVRIAELWSHSRPITTQSAEAQAWFDQGLGFLSAFNHDEAIRAFRAAARCDPTAAMPQWGIAYANGPHINYPLVDESHAAAAWAAVTQAQRLAAGGSPVERALIDALARRYAMPQAEDRRPLDEAYAAGMRDVWRRYPDDADVGALFAEALLDLHPWDQWGPDGKPRADTEEVLAALRRSLTLVPRHPLALHLMIHAVEGSPQPELAADAAATLRALPLKLGHLVHMPSHIDVRLGHWKSALETNVRAAALDAAYRQTAGDQGFYRVYMAHNHHMRAFAAMMRGQSEAATGAIRTMLDEIPAEWLTENALLVDGLSAMPYEMHLRFGRWHDMLSEPEPIEALPIARAVRYYGRGAARAALLDPSEARKEQAAFRAAVKAVPEEAAFSLNFAADVLAIADSVLEGEILYREGRIDEALAALRRAVELEDGLRYIEPPDWIQPTRHILGATLCDAERWEEAAEVYRADLKKNPHNGWSLGGLARALKQLGQADEAARYEAEFELAWIDADVEATSSCLCLPAPQ